jgi:hypothetical protein
VERITNHVEILDSAHGRDSGYKVDASRGDRIGRVSSEWFSRPSDERYLSLSDLYAAVRGRTERSRTRTIESAAIRVEASRDDAERLSLEMPGSESPVAMTHWSFSQLASLVGAPAAYLRQLPGAARWNQPAIWPNFAPRRENQDARNRKR